MKKYLEASPESGKKFYLDYLNKGKIVMLNLLKFNDIADYTNIEELKPKSEISGEEAYNLYIENTLPELKNIGCKIIYYGKSTNFLIGPDFEKWDAVLLLEHQSIEKFMTFSQSKAYLNNVGHRMAGLADSRLLPTTETQKQLKKL
ncbi:DUF1330 domain-containing protein [Algibacter pectinivorans]|uniref:DUF1330 domain-containing protein n=1 Tax=Algibacter pectinivorans TaxID=870482 RepID=A0A1I1R0X1_9FLAO|nr:DUF1330 domain-containing protein [Algibacter pectinivorans]SFD23920.1 hypothetical protein SAMN04487987_10714 [Algibacter pectinivorans]